MKAITVTKTFRGRFGHTMYHVWINQYHDDIKVYYKYCDYNYQGDGVKIVFRLKPNRSFREMV